MSLPVATFEIIDGPDTPEMLWSLQYPDRGQSVQFKSTDAAIEAVITRMDELPDGLTFAVVGKVSSGHHEGLVLRGTYSVGDRRGQLAVG